MAGVYQGEPETAPTLDGRRVPSARVGVWFRPPEEERQALVSLTGAIIDRAALFRPGAVGPWTYVALLVVVVPLLWLISARALARAAAGDGQRARLPLVVVVAAVAFANAATWSLITPPFDAPDEVDHFAYGQYLAETGKAASQEEGGRPTWSGEEGVALDGVRLLSYIEQADGRPPWTTLDERRWAEREARLRPNSDDGGGKTTASTHSPLYYSLLAPAYLAGKGQSVFSRVSAMRLVSALLGAFTAVCVFLLVCELLPRQRFLALAAGLLVAFHPMFSFLSGAINNDMGVNAATALLLFLLVRGLRRGLTMPVAAGIGVTLVAAPLAKATALALYPAAALAIAGMLWRRHSRADMAPYLVLAGAFAVSVAAWALIAPAFDRALFTTPEGRSPVESGGIGTSVLDNPTAYLSYLWQVFLPKLPFMTDLHPQRWPAFDIYVERGWAAFGWYAVMFPGWVYGVITAAMIGAGVLCVAAVLRERPAARRRALELAVLALAVVGVVAGVEAANFTPTGGRQVVAEQGRYAFTAMAALAPIALGACLAFGRRLLVPAVTVMVVSMIGLSFASQLLALAGFYT
jgi:4-amino-4-deoxy-L-arabinose transferase-like glycosyltransferase